MSRVEAVIALNRFGLGARPGELERTGDAREILLRQTADRRAFLLEDARLATSRTAVEALAQHREQQRARREEKAQAPGAGPNAPRPIDQLNDLALADMQARTARALTTETGFAERLVWFWSNHFTVAMNKTAVIPFVGVFEREAIRPNLTGSFADLLFASTRHPGMQLYLDQAQSIGPNSAAGQRRKVGLNENLAREILELHTLGVHGGYDQADVTEFARALTGWTFAGARPAEAANEGPGGRFLFLDRNHEPGDRKVVGRTYAAGGEAQAKAILGDLAQSPATARHVATKLARHFIADDPPPAAVARLEKVFLATGGDLPSLHRALIESPEAWRPEPAKFKSPADFIASTLRLTGVESLPGPQVQQVTKRLGQPLYRAPSPAGWPDTAASWAGPDALMKRLEWVQGLSGRLALRTPPEALAAQGLGPGLSMACIQAVQRAASPAQGLTLALMSPDFQRR